LGAGGPRFKSARPDQHLSKLRSPPFKNDDLAFWSRCAEVCLDMRGYF